MPRPERPLAGRLAVVTGAASGIGRATALRLAADGAVLALLDANRAGVEAVAATAGGAALPFGADVRDRDAIAHAIVAARAAFGPVAILVNNAGIAGGNAPLEAIDDAAYERMFSVHVKGALNMAQAVVGDMKAARHGRIVNIASNRGQVGFERSCHYAGAKAALIAMAKSWARELAPWNVRANAIAPGVVRTAMTLAYGEDAVREEADQNLLGRWAEPEEVAATIAFLVGPEGDFYTGQVLCPNGGDPIVGM
jgi:3-oxoacyl-[acyl-carrier protein] reductase